jgi:hypothetical protein
VIVAMLSPQPSDRPTLEELLWHPLVRAHMNRQAEDGG